jgi:hypothetical protein
MKLSVFIVGSDIGQFFKLKNIGEVFKKVPLPEDVALKGLSLMKTSHDAVNWQYHRHYCLHVKEEVSSVIYHKDILRLS